MPSGQSRRASRSCQPGHAPRQTAPRRAWRTRLASPTRRVASPFWCAREESASLSRGSERDGTAHWSAASRASLSSSVIQITIAPIRRNRSGRGRIRCAPNGICVRASTRWRVAVLRRAQSVLFLRRRGPWAFASRSARRRVNRVNRPRRSHPGGIFRAHPSPARGRDSEIPRPSNVPRRSDSSPALEVIQCSNQCRLSAIWDATGARNENVKMQRPRRIIALLLHWEGRGETYAFVYAYRLLNYRAARSRIRWEFEGGRAVWWHFRGESIATGGVDGVQGEWGRRSLRRL